MSYADATEQEEIDEAFKDYPAIFVGSIVDVRRFFDPGETLGGRARLGHGGFWVEEVVFEVLESLKGTQAGTCKTRTVIQGGLCGLSIGSQREKYLVYTAPSRDGTYMLSTCSRTVEYESVQAEAAFLRSKSR